MDTARGCYTEVGYNDFDTAVDMAIVNWHCDNGMALWMSSDGFHPIVRGEPAREIAALRVEEK